MKMERQQELRRKFLRMGLSGLGLFAAGSVIPYKSSIGKTPDTSFSLIETFGDLLPPDENGVMLPQGFRSRIVARSGESPLPSSKYKWHDSPDGGACFEADDGGWVYVSNSERPNKAGGVGALRFNSSGEIIDAYSILQNTSLNCAGGPTPWGTWLSCEETPNGLVYECDPFGNTIGKAMPALGVFKHEAAAVDLERQVVYLTEDLPDGGFYRFRPDHGFPDLTSGKLEVASVLEEGGRKIIRWIPVPDSQAREKPTRKQVPGYTSFRGGEGVAIYDDVVYFTTKHDNRVWAYDSVSGELSVIYDAEIAKNPELTGVDNIVISPAGDVLVAEDSGNMQIIALTRKGSVIPIVQIVGHDRSEIAGPAFDPSFQRLYFSSQRGSIGDNKGGMTFEISLID